MARVLGYLRRMPDTHEPVYLSRMLTLQESEVPGHADYVKEFRTCVITLNINTSDLQMGYLVNSRFVEGLSNDAVRRQYIVEVPSKWRSGRPFGFDTLLEVIAEAYMAAGYQLQEVQNASRPMGDTTGAAISRPLPMMVPPTSTSTMFPSSPVPTLHINPVPTPAAAPMASTAPEPMNLNTIAKLGEELRAYIGERRNDLFNRQDSRETRRCYNSGEQGHLARDCQKNRPPSRGGERRESRSSTPRRDLSRDSKGRARTENGPHRAKKIFRRAGGGYPREELNSAISTHKPEKNPTLGSVNVEGTETEHATLDAFPWEAWPRDAAVDTHRQAGRQSTALTGASSRSCHVTKRFRILATLQQGNGSMYSNTSGYVHMGLRLD